MSPSTQARPIKILVRGVNWLGDAVMTTPALQRLREARQQDSITVLTDAKLADLWKDHPAISGAISFSRSESVFAVARRLREHHFDLALIFPNSFRSALECWLARIPARIGYPGNGRNLLLTQCVPHPAKQFRMHKRSPREIRRLISQAPTAAAPEIPKIAHHIYHYLHLANALGANLRPVAPRIHVSEDERLAFSKRFELGGMFPLLGLNAGAEYGPAKRWPAENFIAAAIAISRATKCSWLVFGGAADRELASQIASEINSACSPESRAINTAGETTLRELCAGLALCPVVLTNDSGPMHLAAAVGCRAVVPFGSTSPELTGPGLSDDERHVILRATVPCAPCFRRVCPIDLRCLKQIAVSEAVAAVLKMQSISATQ